MQKLNSWARSPVGIVGVEGQPHRCVRKIDGVGFGNYVKEQAVVGVAHEPDPACEAKYLAGLDGDVRGDRDAELSQVSGERREFSACRSDACPKDGAMPMAPNRLRCLRPRLDADHGRMAFAVVMYEIYFAGWAGPVVDHLPPDQLVGS